MFAAYRKWRTVMQIQMCAASIPSAPLNPLPALQRIMSFCSHCAALWMNTIPFLSNLCWVNTSTLMNMLLKVIFESLSQYRWCERRSSNEPLNSKRLFHELGLWEELWWESMNPSGSESCVSNVCALWWLLSHSLIVCYSEIIYPLEY